MRVLWIAIHKCKAKLSPLLQNVAMLQYDPKGRRNISSFICANDLNRYTLINVSNTVLKNLIGRFNITEEDLTQ